MAKRMQTLTLDQALDGLPADFGFFAERYRTQIQPGLAGREAERVAAVKRQQRYGLIAVVAAVVIAGGGFALFNTPFVLAAAVAAGGGIWAWGGMALSKLGHETKLMLVEPVANQFGMQFEMAPPPPGAMLRCRDLGLVPSWDRAKYEDQLTGQRGDAPFEFFEAHLEDKRTTTDGKGNTRTTWVTVFRGQCLAVRFHKPFEGITKVFRDAGFMNSFMKLGQKLPRVKLEDPVFEKAFEVYGSDQVEARFILTPDFMERLLLLEKTFEGKQLRCAFSGGEMFLCVAGKNLLEPGSMHRPMDDLNRVREMLLDFAAVFLLIDAMSQRRTPDALRGAVEP
ncbi:MAG: DUF3137 domain-containing protein [Alphaproteobacteria bacterium]|nr:DUF3137 domain-containing protein [Alphaproteobacteria bacterium]